MQAFNNYLWNFFSFFTRLECVCIHAFGRWLLFPGKNVLASPGPKVPVRLCLYNWEKKTSGIRYCFLQYPTYTVTISIINFLATKGSCRCEQDSNLRGETPLDFKSNSLTTRPSQLMNLIIATKTKVSDTFYITATLQSFGRYRRFKIIQDNVSTCIRLSRGLNKIFLSFLEHVFSHGVIFESSLPKLPDTFAGATS